MRHTIAVAALALLPSLAHAVPLTPGANNPLVLVSTANFDTTGVDYGNAVALMGNTPYVAGYTAGATDGWVGRYDSALNLTSSATFNISNADNFNAITTYGGNVYAGGYYIILNGPTYDYEAVVAKYDADLVYQSSVGYAGAAGNTYAVKALAANANGVYAAGYSWPSTSASKIWIGKYTHALVEVVKSTAIVGTGGTIQSRADAIALDSNGDVYAAGTIGTASNPASGQIFIARYTSSLVLVSSRAVTGYATNPVAGSGIAIVGSNIYVAGMLSQGGTNTDAWIGKFDTSLNLVSSAAINGTNATFTGLAAGPATLYAIGSVDIGNTEILYANYDLNLNLLGTVTDGNDTASTDKGYGIALAPDGSIYSAGTSYVTGTNFDVYAAKLSTGAVPAGFTGFGTDHDELDFTWGEVSGSIGYLFNGELQSGTTYHIGGVTPSSATLGYVSAQYLSGSGPLSAGVTAYFLADGLSDLLVTGVSASTITVNFNKSNNPDGTQYNIQYWTAGGATTTVTSVLSTATLTGLTNSTTYFLRANSQNGQGQQTGYTLEVSTTTNPPAPATAPTGVAGVAAAGGIGFSWNSVAGATGYRVRLGVGVAAPSIATVAGTVYNPSIFVANQANWMEVQAGNPYGYGPLSASVTVYTLANAPTLPEVINVSVSSVVFRWGQNANPVTTLYQVTYGPVGGSTTTFLAPSGFTVPLILPPSTATITGLTAGTTYFFNVKAQNGDGILTTAVSITTVTHPTPPAAPTGLTGTAVSGGINFTWNAVPGAVNYRFHYGVGLGGYLSIVQSGTSYSASTNVGNQANWFEVQATDNYDYGPLSASVTTYTFAKVPASPAASDVFVTSATLSWNTNSNPDGTTYFVQYGLVGGSSTTLASTTSSTRTLTGLQGGTTYFLSVLAHNGDAIATAAVSITTVTGPTVAAVESIDSSAGGSIEFQPPSGAVVVDIPPASFNQAVTVTVQVPTSIPGDTGSNTVGTGVAIEILLDVVGAQPTKPVTLSISYPANVGTTFDPSLLIICRYDVARGVWVPLPSRVDTATGKVIAVTDHFSLFQIMSISPSASFSAAKVFPNPFRKKLGHTTVTFSQLPGGSTLKIYTLAGEKVAELTANGSGLANWDARNGAGHLVGSGVYLVHASAPGGGSTILKVAIQR